MLASVLALTLALSPLAPQSRSLPNSEALDSTVAQTKITYTLTPYVNGQAGQPVTGSLPNLSSGTVGNTTPGSIQAPGNLTPSPLAVDHNRFRRWPAPGFTGLFELRIIGLPSGYLERFIVQVPTNPAATNSPLLLGFHGFGVSMFDIFLNTDFFVEAENRGWFLVAPMAASQTHLSSEAAHMNVEYLLNVLTRVYDIDMDRIYAVGFSMGAGFALNYAARHLDPEKPMFAAVVNHTGVLSNRHSYEYDCLTPDPEPCPTQSEYEFWFSGPPLTSGFNYARSSVIDMGLLSGTVDPDTDFARNLIHVPIEMWLATQDPLMQLVDQNFQFVYWFVGKGGSLLLHTVVDHEHTWANLNETTACDFLAQHTLTLPTSANTLADRSGKWFYFDLTQQLLNQFSRFSWDVDATGNTLSLTDTHNVNRLVVDTLAAGLDPLQVLTFTTSSADATSDSLEFEDFAVAPQSITRDALPFAGWSYDAQLQRVIIPDTDGALTHTWQITP